MIYQQVNKFLSDEDAVMKFFYLVPMTRDAIVNIAQGLYSANNDIVIMVVEILMKMERSEIGRHYIQGLNYFFKLRY